MTFPTVTELVPVLEPVTVDTFIVIAGDKPIVPAFPIRSRRIVD